MTVEAAIDQVHAKGLRVNNLFELRTGRWRANLRREEECFAFGEGDTAEQALQAALLDFDKFSKTHAAFMARRAPAQPPTEDIFG